MHMNDGRVVSNFILQALQDDPITVSQKNTLEKIFLREIKYFILNVD